MALWLCSAKKAVAVNTMHMNNLEVVASDVLEEDDFQLKKKMI